MAAALNCAADEHPLRSQLERVKSPILSVSRDSGGKRRSVIAAAPILSVFAGTKAGLATAAQLAPDRWSRVFCTRACPSASCLIQGRRVSGLNAALRDEIVERARR